jgi:hypothetical protein
MIVLLLMRSLSTNRLEGQEGLLLLRLAAQVAAWQPSKDCSHYRWQCSTLRLQVILTGQLKYPRQAGAL